MSYKALLRGTKRSVRPLIAHGEGAKLEFKQSLEADARTGAKDPKALDGVLKTVAAFLNTDGGTLLLGVTDEGTIRGLQQDYALLGKKQNADGFELKLRDLLRSHLKPLSLRSLTITTQTFPEGTVCAIHVHRATNVAYLNGKEVFVRDGNTTRKLEGPDLAAWLSDHNSRRRWRMITIAGLALLVSTAIAYSVLFKPAVALPTKPIRAGTDEPLNPCAVQPAPLENAEAKRLYNEGCQKTSTLDYPRAILLFQQATKIEPQSVSAHVALADAWSWLGYDDRATQEATTALELAKQVSPEMRLWVRARAWEIQNDFDKATETYEALWKMSPDKLEYGLQLVTVQIEADDAHGALTTIAALRKLPSRDDPRIDLQEAEAAELLDEFTHQRTAAEHALQKSNAQHQTLLAAEAKRWLGLAHRHLGEREDAKRALNEAKNTFSALGDQLGAALAQHELAGLIQEQGDLQEALLFYKELQRFYKDIGNKRNLASALNSIADVLAAQGDTNGAITAYEDVIAATTNVRDKSGLAAALARKADLLVWKGALSAAGFRRGTPAPATPSAASL